MGKSYNKPALIEIYTEVYFEDGVLQQDKFFEIVPILKNKGFSTVEFTQAEKLIPVGEPAATKNVYEQVVVPRIRCWNSERTNLVQVSPDLVVVNKVGNYLGWTDYKSTFEKAISAVFESGIKSAIKSVKLVTIDSIKVVKDGFAVGKYLNCGGPRLPSWYSQTKEAFDITLGLGFQKVDNFNRQIKVVGRPKADTYDIRIESYFHESLLGKTTNQVLETLHEESTNSFESIITDLTRNDVMQGIKK